jgi:YggT family protein
MQALLWLILQLINIYLFIIFISIVLSWLVAFDVINLRNRFVYMIYDITNRLTQPIYRPFQRMLPNLGGLDLSPMIVVLLLIFIQRLLVEYWPAGL